jgi:hypothetical protein
MTTKHLGIRDAVAALYAAGTPLADGRIIENRDLTLPDGVASQIQIYRIESTPDRPILGSSAPVDWTTEIETVVKARKSGATSAEVVAENIVAACYARVMADQTLGGLCWLIDPGPIAWDQDEAATNVVVARWRFAVRHTTENNVIT